MNRTNLLNYILNGAVVAAIGWTLCPRPYDYYLVTILLLPLACCIAAFRMQSKDELEFAGPEMMFRLLLLSVLVDFQAGHWQIISWAGFRQTYLIFAGVVLCFACYTLCDLRKPSAALIGALAFALVYSLGAVVSLNCFLDHSVPVSYITRVTGKNADVQYVRRVATTVYFVTYADVPGLEGGRIGVTRPVYIAAKPGDGIKINTFSGFFNLPWLTREWLPSGT